jgi:hypothetical protein
MLALVAPERADYLLGSIERSEIAPSLDIRERFGQIAFELRIVMLAAQDYRAIVAQVRLDQIAHPEPDLLAHFLGNGDLVFGSDSRDFRGHNGFSL